MRQAAPLALLLLLLAAGCLQGGAPHDPAATARDAVRLAAQRVLALDHDQDGGHHDAAFHEGARNLELVGYSNGVDDSGDPARIPASGTYNELALTGSLVLLSRTSRDGSFGGLSVIDAADPAAPRVVGQFQGQGAVDVEVTSDGALAFLAVQRTSVEQVVGGARPGDDPQANAPRGIHMVDLSDPARPTSGGFVPLPTNGPHTLTLFDHPNGGTYLVACTYDLVTEPGGAIVAAAPATQRLVVYLVAPDPGGGAVPGLPRASLVPVAQYQRVAAAPGSLVFPHDATVQVHPSGRVLLTVAYWDLGVRILDFSAPPGPAADGALPTLPEVGSFTDFAPSAFNAIHLAQAFDTMLAGPRGPVHVTVAEPEIIDAGEETGQITFLDTTDPSSPRKISWWTLPPQAPPLHVRDLDFSPHNVDTWDGKLAVAHYHAGLWVVDLSTPESLAEPKETAFYMTARHRPNSPAPQPYTWSVREQGGLLYATDEASGLYILRYTGP